jgi:hypothetical protein
VPLARVERRAWGIRSGLGRCVVVRDRPRLRAIASRSADGCGASRDVGRTCGRDGTALRRPLQEARTQAPSSSPGHGAASSKRASTRSSASWSLGPNACTSRDRAAVRTLAPQAQAPRARPSPKRGPRVPRVERRASTTDDEAHARVMAPDRRRRTGWRTRVPLRHGPARPGRDPGDAAEVPAERGARGRPVTRFASDPSATPDPGTRLADDDPAARFPATWIADDGPAARFPATWIADDGPAAHFPGTRIADDDLAARFPATRIAEDDPAARFPATRIAEDDPAAHFPAARSPSAGARDGILPQDRPGRGRGASSGFQGRSRAGRSPASGAPMDSSSPAHRLRRGAASWPMAGAPPAGLLWTVRLPPIACAMGGSLLAHGRSPASGAPMDSSSPAHRLRNGRQPPSPWPEPRQRGSYGQFVSRPSLAQWAAAS